MEGLEKLKGSWKAYRSHLTSLFTKLEDLNLSQPATDETTTTAMSYIDQLQCKAESIQQLDVKILEEPGDIESDVLDSIETQDTIIHKLTCPKHHLEKASTPVTTTVTPSLPPVTNSTASRSATASRLPKLDLPRYSGEPLWWQTFWDSF